MFWQLNHVLNSVRVSFQRSWPESWLFGYWSCEAAREVAHEAVPNGPWYTQVVLMLHKEKLDPPNMASNLYLLLLLGAISDLQYAGLLFLCFWAWLPDAQWWIFFAVPVIMLTYALGTSLLDPIFERARANVKPITAVHFVPPKTSFPFFFSWTKPIYFMFLGLMIMSNHVRKADKNPPEWIGQSDFPRIACAL
jgi:hypothetical protein